MADETQRPSKKQKISHKDVDTLPGEVRNEIWRQMLLISKTSKEEKAQPVVIWQLHLDDPQVCNIQEVDAGNAHRSKITPSKSTPLDQQELIKAATKSFAEFLSEVSPETIFAFANTEALQKFAALINPHLQASVDYKIKLRLLLPLFDESEETFDSMTGWKSIKQAHGYAEEARSHVQEWMDVVQTIECPCEVFLEFGQHWRDYRALRGVTRSLREKDGWTLEVLAKDSAWNGIPDADLHKSLTVASVKGVELQIQRDMGQAQAADLVGHGCRGLRPFEQYVKASKTVSTG
ncbi:hypothetical protein M409DRAFT_18257 [Zasmidium cellare ATCC 36951]|uniref:Uncharacterized protein n=1 Tax=Zasmidium cellare ATCC 36951 TaxID=1080233 RepID=A0A6A6D0S9_ZASCE|nr:uncharacterized protein M409DRAFT_18257 [Zasmidium cellare ATCC 36951]KAF2172028.1 hypothetical protein M409DRAFT_18257 [Zasmidium cellare ATCC 36951]